MTLTQQDLNAIRDLISVTVDEVIEKKELVTRSMINHLPTKEEFYTQMDKIMTELKAMREEHVLLSARVYETTNQESEKSKRNSM